jgi:hypothetical protein
VTEDRDIANWDAAYVLGALSARERLEYEDFLADNPQRAAGLTEIAALPGILNLLSPEEALALNADDAQGGEVAKPLNLMPSLARAAEKRQRRTRRYVITMMAATAAAFLAVGVIVASAIFGRPGSAAGPSLQAMTSVGRGGITAELAVSEKQWGTRLDWSCQYTKDWSRKVGSYDLVVTTVDGKQTTVGSWRPAGDEASGLSAATVIPTAQIRTVDIRESGSAAPLAEKTLR